MEEHHVELDQLNGGKMLLPPQIFLHVWSHRGAHVVRVHDDVDHVVDDVGERAVATSNEFDEHPRLERSEGVMVQV